MGNLNKNKNIKEVVAICDQLDGAVTKCDLKNINIESLIHIVRGQKVMLDSLEDLKSQNAISNSEDEEMNERLTSQIAILKDMGAGMCAVTKMEVSPELILGLIK